MKMVKLSRVLVAVSGLGVLLLVAAPAVYGQRSERGRQVPILIGRGTEIGAFVRDAAPAGNVQAGVVVEEVRADGPAERAGLKPSDVVTEFDGERVRSVRQFSRLVRETVPGREVKVTFVRDGQNKDVQLTPTEGRGATNLGGRLPPILGGRLPPIDFDFDFDVPGLSPRGRLGVTVQNLTSQLAQFFGTKDGVLVTAVTDNSPAARAGLKAGDVITSINGAAIRSREKLLQELRDVGAKGDAAEVTLGVVRNKKETTLKATIEPIARRPTRSRSAV